MTGGWGREAGVSWSEGCFDSVEKKIMINFTRRALMRTGGMAAGAVMTGALTAPGQMKDDTVFHVFAFEWKPGTTEEQKQRAARDIAAFQGKIPGLLQTHVGNNLSPRGKNYTFGGVMQFKNQAALDAYVQHPSHQALLVWLRPLIDPIELDLKA